MLKNILLIVISIFLLSTKANADIGGFAGVGQACPNSYFGNGMSTPWDYVFTGRTCAVGSAQYVPVSGYYSAETILYFGNSPTPIYTFTTGSAYIDANQKLFDQNVYPSGGEGTYRFTLQPGQTATICAYLIGPDGKKFSVGMDVGQGLTRCYDGYTPLPPTPTTSCSINNGNALSVSLGTLNRDEIPTAPDSGSAISKTISVVCTGGTVTTNMQLNYTPISVGSNQAVKTSANGVGAAIFYSNKVLSPSDVTSVNFLEGSNTLTLGFQAVRDSTVALKDIPTGAFTASAVLVMTQQ